MANSEDSKHIAEYYAKARGIPDSHILLLEGKPQTDLPRATWDRKTRPEILKLLDKRNLTDKIRCLVTCWDVPLSIAPLTTGSTGYMDRKIALNKERAERVAELDELISGIEAVGRADPPRAKLPTPASAKEERLKTDFNTALQSLQQRSRNLTSDADKARVQAAFQNAFLRVSGSTGMLQLMAPRTEEDKKSLEKTAQRFLIIGRIQGLQQAVSAMEGLPETVARDQEILDFVESKAGLFGAVRWIDQQLHLLKQNESMASFDSELSMIFYADHSSLSWLPNPLHYSQDGSRRRRTMMVARLAAPSVKIVERMIDDAIATEKEGLKGNVYIDARGLQFKSGEKNQDTYAIYDQSLRDLADRLRKHTSLTVVSDNRKELFQPGTCPNVALYCGWYSVKKYIDAFDWSRGAVGYHLASFEAKWLIEPSDDSKPNERPWCPYMLKDGACATLGPVAEPYLSAFPLPDDFFPLLLTGKMTLAEVFYRTKRFNSWMLVLVGDPLYTPYKVNPMMDVKNLPERLVAARPKSENPTAAESN